jgi:hypothetical protein
MITPREKHAHDGGEGTSLEWSRVTEFEDGERESKVAKTRKIKILKI